jgi:hypothetical protein
VKRQTKDSPKMAATKMQLERLLAVPVPVILSKQALQSKNEFSCGGTHVVKLNAYADLKKLKHVEEVLPDMDLFYASRNDKIFDRCAVVRPTARSNADQDAPVDDGGADPTGHCVRAAGGQQRIDAGGGARHGHRCTRRGGAV